jgi:hypothetical protein
MAPIKASPTRSCSITLHLALDTRRNSTTNASHQSSHSTTRHSLAFFLSSHTSSLSRHPQHQPAGPTLHTRIADYTATMTFPSKPSKVSKHTFSTTHNPWKATTSSPNDELRRSFKAFCQMENFRRADRGEQPFCSNLSRDKAFEKLMRLSRGEEPIGWAIEPTTEAEECGVEAWYANFFKDEEGGVKIKEEKKTEEKKVNEEKKEELTGIAGAGGHERKDSKEVASKGEHRWRRGKNEEQDVNEDEEDMEAEYMEDVGKLM